MEVHGYELLREIGRGGMATVHLARQVELDRLVALKRLDALADESDSRLRRFLRESRLAGSLNHPNIVTVHDSFEDDGVPFIAMELVPGGTLRQILGSLSLEQAAGVLDGVLSGLAHAERRGIVHRDLKPENLLVAIDGEIKITDFGIAKATGEARGSASLLTSVGTTIGTPAYMAPEQAMGEQVGPWTDLYALGVVAFEMLAGRVPFAGGDTSMSVLLQQVNDLPPELHELRPEVDRELSDWVGALLAKDPEDRPASAAAARDELEDIVLRLRGPRWRRAAPLPVAAAAVLELTSARTAVGPSTALATPPTAVAEAWAAPTATRLRDAAPPPPPPPATPVSGWSRGRRVPRGVALLVVFAIAALAIAAGTRGGQAQQSASHGGAAGSATTAASHTPGTTKGSSGSATTASTPSTAPVSSTAAAPKSSASKPATSRPAAAAPPATAAPPAAAAPPPAAVAVDAGRVADAMQEQRRWAAEAQDTEGDGDEALTQLLRNTSYAYGNAAAAGQAGDGARFAAAMAQADQLAQQAAARVDG